MADQDDPVIAGLVQKLIAENASDEDIRAVIQEHKGQTASKQMNLSRVLGREATPENFKLPMQQYNTPELAPRPKNTGDLVEAALRSKGIERSPEANQMSRNMAEGAMSGGLSTAAVPFDIAKKAVGPSVSGPLIRGGERLYGGLLKAKDATINSFPTVVQDLIAAGAPISQAGRRKMLNVMKTVGAEKGALLNAADQRAMIPRETVRQGLDTSLDAALASSPRPVKDLTTLAKIEKELIPDTPGMLPSHADRIKTTLQTEAKSGYTGRKLGNKVTDTVANAKMNMAGKLKDALETIEPQLEGVNQAYATAKGGAQALRDATKRTSKHNVFSLSNLIAGLVGTGVGGPGVGTATGIAAVNAVNNPNIGSRIAIGMDRLGRIPRLDDVTKGITKAALLKLLSTTQPQLPQAPEE